MNDLFNQRRERGKKRIINYFCELLHRRDNKPALSPWIWHICSENNTIISKGEGSGENMRTPGLKCQWSIPVLISIPENNNRLLPASTQYTHLLMHKRKKQWPFTKSMQKRNVTSWCCFLEITTNQTHKSVYSVFKQIVCSTVGESQKTCLTATESTNSRKKRIDLCVCARAWKRAHVCVFERVYPLPTGGNFGKLCACDEKT